MSPDDLASLWSQERISVEMAIGHITQNLVKLQATLDAHRHLLTELRVDLERQQRDSRQLLARLDVKQRSK